MIFSVCPHDIVKQMQTWLDFSIYLASHLGAPVKLRQAIDFKAFYESLPQSDIVFVNPMDAWRLHTEEQFLPLFQTELYDEVVFFTSAESPNVDLSALNGQPVGAVDRQFATYLGLFLLEQKGIRVSEPLFSTHGFR